MSSTESYRVVMDTNVIIAAGSQWVDADDIKPESGKLAQELIYCVANNHTGLYCGAMMGEYLEKLIDLKHPKDRLLKLMTYLLGAFEQVSVTSTECDPAPTDEDDLIFLLCAIDGKAHYLVSSDKHLLALAASYDPPKIMSDTDVSGHLQVSHA